MSNETFDYKEIALKIEGLLNSGEYSELINKELQFGKLILDLALYLCFSYFCFSWWTF